MTMMRLIAGLAVALNLTQPACADAKHNALNHIAQAMAIAGECPDYELMFGNVMILTLGFKIDLNDPATKKEMFKLTLEHRDGLLAAGTKVGCLVGWSLYGAGGANVPDLIRRR